VVLITTGAPENSRKTCSPGNPAPGRNPGLRPPRYRRHLKKVLYENDLKIKNKPNPKTSYLYNENICRPPRPHPCETIPLSGLLFQKSNFKFFKNPKLTLNSKSYLVFITVAVTHDFRPDPDPNFQNIRIQMFD
jgi:hypothetical protein